MSKSLSDAVWEGMRAQMRANEAASQRHHRAEAALTQTQIRLRDEVIAAVSGEADQVALTPFQERIRATVTETEDRLTAFVNALDPTDADTAKSAAEHLVGGLLGHVLALEARVGAMEIADGGQ